MNRRDFFGYSLIVLADRAEAQTAAPAHPEFDRVAASAAGFAPNEPHMRLVPLDCDLLVAGGGLAGVCAAIAAARHGAKVVSCRFTRGSEATRRAKSKCT